MTDVKDVDFFDFFDVNQQSSRHSRTQPALLVIDVETTGLDPWVDKIVQVGLHEYEQDWTPRRSMNLVINPGLPIPPEATKVHGLNDHHVKLAPHFDKVAELLQSLIDDKPIFVGYNLSFDLKAIHAELTRHGYDGISYDFQCIDPWVIFKKFHPHTLDQAVQFYLDTTHTYSHNAYHDALMTAKVLKEQMRRHRLEVQDATQFRYAKDLDGKLVLDDSATVVFGFGKHKGEPVTSHPSYLEWMLTRPFDPGTKLQVRLILDQHRKNQTE